MTRYTLSSSWRMLRQVSPVVFSTNAQQKQGQPARLDVGADAVLRWVEHRPQLQRTLHVPPAAEAGKEPFVVGGEGVGAPGEGREVRSNHLPSRCASRLIAAASTRSNPVAVRCR